MKRNAAKPVRAWAMKLPSGVLGYCTHRTRDDCWSEWTGHDPDGAFKRELRREGYRPVRVEIREV